MFISYRCFHLSRGKRFRLYVIMYIMCTVNYKAILIQFKLT